MLRDENAAGVILSPTRKAIEEFARSYADDMPMVMIDRHVTTFEVDNVVIDNVK